MFVVEHADSTTETSLCSEVIIIIIIKHSAHQQALLLFWLHDLPILIF